MLRLIFLIITSMPLQGVAQTSPLAIIEREPSLDHEEGASLDICAQNMVGNLLRNTRLETARLAGMRYIPASGHLWNRTSEYYDFSLVDEERGIRFEGRIYVQIRHYAAAPSRGVREARTACELLRSCTERRNSFSLTLAGETRPTLATSPDCPYAQPVRR